MNRLIRTLVTAGFLITAALSASATVLHQWNFNDAAGTLITGTAASTGSGAAIAWTNPSGDLTTGGGWRTSGEGQLQIQTVSGGTVLQSLAPLGGSLANGANGVRFDWNVSWSFDGPNGSGATRDIYLINRNVGGASNIFRFSIELPEGSSAPALYAEGTLKGRGGALVGNLGLTGSAVLRVDYFFAPDNTAITGVTYGYSLNGDDFVSVSLNAGPNTVTNMGDLRLHAKGNYSATNYFALDSISVSSIPEPSAYAALFGFGALALVAARRRIR
jgi:hypothetical protein